MIFNRSLLAAIACLISLHPEDSLAGKVGSTSPGKSSSTGVSSGSTSGTVSSSSSSSTSTSTSAATAAKDAVYNYFVAACSAELTGTRPAANERIVCRALTQLGLCDSDRGAGIFPRGQVDYTFGHPEAWCSEFVSFNYLAAGLAMKGGDIPELPWLLRNVDTVRSYFSSKGAYFTNDGTQVPGAGDWLELREGSHSGIAMGVSGNYLVSIEGNVGGCVAIKVRKDFTNAASSDLVGWGSASTLSKRFVGSGVSVAPSSVTPSSR